MRQNMRTLGKKKLGGIVLLLASASLRAETPCTGVDRTLTKQGGATLAAIAKQLDVKRVLVHQSFRFGGWSILYVSTFETDDAYVFYRSDPARSHYVTLWGGVAIEDEEQEIRDWSVKNAPGVPPILARCFAWHVAKEH